MNGISEILLGGVPQDQQRISMAPAAPQPQQANPFANLANISKMMETDPQGAQERFRELARRGIRPPEFTPDTFLQYVQSQQSQGNQAMKQAGTGMPATGSAPIMPMPPARNLA